MKHVFIMNPLSGKRRSREKFISKLKSVAESLKIDYEIYFTKGPLTAKGMRGSFARSLMQRAKICVFTAVEGMVR